MYPDFEPQQEFHTGWSRRKRVLFGLISLALVLGLLVTALEAIIWLWSGWRDGRTEQADVAAPVVAAETRPAESAGVAVVTREGVAETAVSSTLPPSPVLQINRIAFITQSGEIATISPDGENLYTLTDTDKRFQFPAWSPDGQYLAAIGGNREGAGIYLLQDGAELGEPDERYFSRTRGPVYLYWSPDSSQLSFIANHTGGDLALYLASVAGDPAPRVLSTGSPFYWNWFSSGQQILIHSGGTGENARLALLDLNGEGRDEIIAVPGLFQAPAVSADGRFWAYAEEQGEGLSWLTVWDRENDSMERRRHAGLIAMGWSPTANQIAVISGRPDATDFFGPLRMLDLDLGEERMIARDTVLSFFWSPDGQYLAYISIAGFTDDVQAAGQKKVGAAKSAAPVTDLRLLAQQEDPHRFRLHVVDMATGESRLLAQYTPTFTFLSQFLPYFDQYAHSHRIWSPDSQALVLPMRIDGRNRIAVVPIDGTPFQPIANGDMPFWSQQ